MQESRYLESFILSPQPAVAGCAVGKPEVGNEWVREAISDSQARKVCGWRRDRFRHSGRLHSGFLTPPRSGLSHCLIMPYSGAWHV